METIPSLVGSRKIIKTSNHKSVARLEQARVSLSDSSRLETTRDDLEEVLNDDQSNYIDTWRLCDSTW